MRVERTLPRLEHVGSPTPQRLANEIATMTQAADNLLDRNAVPGERHDCRIGILTPRFLREKRRYAIVILFIISEIITPPDLFSCLLVFIPLYLLFEISVQISGRVVNARNKQQS